MTSTRASRVAVWAAGALALGWLVAAATALAYPGGHPPAWFVAGEGVVMASFVIAPIGVGAALLSLWRARRQGASTPHLTVVALASNLLFLLVAVGLWLWLMSVTA